MMKKLKTPSVIGFRPDAEDMAILARLRKRLEESQGKVGYGAIIRWALRLAERKP